MSESLPFNDPQDGRPWAPEALARRHPEIAECLYLVEATPFEAAMLWKTRSRQSPTKHGDYSKNPLDWEGGQAHGKIIHVADIEGRPMRLILRREVIERVPVCFYSVAAGVANFALVEKFMKAVFPEAKSTNAANFHHFRHEAEALAAKAEALALRGELAQKLPQGVKASRGAAL